MKSLNVERAKRALESVKQNQTKEFLSAARRLPSMLVRSGLLGAVAYGLDKKDAKLRVVEALWSWLKKQGFVETELSPNPSQEERTRVLEEIVGMDDARRMAATQEAVEFAIWLSKMASAVIEEKEEGGEAE